MTIIAIRHTTVDVPSEICYGQSDVGLSASFEREMEQLAQKLKLEDFQAVYSSPLSRCRKLAQYIASDTSVIFDPRLKELNFGKWEGKTWNYIYESAEGKKWFNDWLNVACPEGESYQQLIDRVNEFLNHLKHSNKNVLLVTHSGVIRALFSLINGTDPKEALNIKIEYGSVIKLKLNG